MAKVFIIGGGAAGIMAALTAAKRSHNVSLFEKNDKLGKKLFITGKGRCNITNLCDEEDFLQNVVHNEKFLYSSIYTLNSQALVDMLEDFGLSCKLTRGNRIFPSSDKSSDLIKILEKELREAGVKIYLNSKVDEIIAKNKKICGIKLKSKEILCDKVVLATGGLSYKATGSTGDGYAFAKKLGHRVIPLRAGLVPFNSSDPYCKSLSGLSLKNVRLSIQKSKKILYSDIGELLFTHFGISGPLVLSASSFVEDKDLPIKANIDLKPYLDNDTFYKRISKDFEKYANKDFINSLDDLAPKSLIPIIVGLSGIKERKKCNQISRTEKLKLSSVFKEFPINIISKRDINEAIITMGGIDLKEVDSSSMQSKKIEGLYFVGEVLDLDALTGGFNLQIAFSTGYLCGISI